MFSILLGLAMVQANPVDAWSNCLTSQVERLSMGSATVDAVADQAMRACSSHQLNVNRFITRDAGAVSAGEIQGLLDTMNRDMRREMRTAAIAFRAARRPAASARAAPARTTAPATSPANRDAIRRQARVAAARPATSVRRGQLRFRVFNGSTGTITGYAMINSNGSASANWLRAPIAPQAFRSLASTPNAVCSQSARVTFANNRTTTRPVDLCGKTILYVSNTDIWAE